MASKSADKTNVMRLLEQKKIPYTVHTVENAEGLTGVEIAYDLVLRGKKPVVVEMQEDILKVPGLCAANSNMLREIIRYYKIPVLTKTSLSGVSADSDGLKVLVKDAEGTEQELPADSVILSVGYVSDRSLFDRLSDGGVPAEKLHLLGDANEVGNLMSVIREAWDLCYTL